jgi:predicted Kef-type K+ transport protein
VLALLAQGLLLMLVADYVGLSMELGAFVAGLQVSSRHASSERAAALLAPLRDVFAALFFTALGLHVYPQFLWQEWRVLVALAAIVVAAKVVLGLVFYRGVFRYPAHTALRIAVGLAQLSEFGFVVAARAKVLGLVSREVYHLLLGGTALTLLATPLLWRLTASGRSSASSASSPFTSSSQPSPPPLLPKTVVD